MVNNYLKRAGIFLGSLFTRWVAIVVMLAVFMAHTSHEAEGSKAIKYKKQTVVDFEGALVEGKSRKPYSSYLTQQKDSAFNDLSAWTPDFDRLWKNTLEKADQNL